MIRVMILPYGEKIITKTLFES